MAFLVDWNYDNCAGKLKVESITTTSNGKVKEKHINIKVGILWGKIQIKSYKKERKQKIHKKVGCIFFWYISRGIKKVYLLCHTIKFLTCIRTLKLLVIEHRYNKNQKRTEIHEFIKAKQKCANKQPKI